MKITKSKLKQLIKEETDAFIDELTEAVGPDIDWSKWPREIRNTKEFCFYAKKMNMPGLCSMRNLRRNWESYRKYVSANRDVSRDLPNVAKATSGGAIAKRKIDKLDKATGKLRRMNVKGRGFGVRGQVKFEGLSEAGESQEIDDVIRRLAERLFAAEEKIEAHEEAIEALVRQKQDK